MNFHSCAKLNLQLEVLGRRADGYHELRTVFQTIDLADEVRGPGDVQSGARSLTISARLPEQSGARPAEEGVMFQQAVAQALGEPAS